MHQNRASPFPSDLSQGHPQHFFWPLSSQEESLFAGDLRREIALLLASNNRAIFRGGVPSIGLQVGGGQGSFRCERSASRERQRWSKIAPLSAALWDTLWSGCLHEHSLRLGRPGRLRPVTTWFRFSYYAPASLQKCVGDFCCMHVEGFCQRFAWRIPVGIFFLHTWGGKIHKRKSGGT